MSHTGGISGSRASHRANSSAVSTKGFDPGRIGFTIADVLAWARTKPAGERYSYCDPFGCAVAQFGRDTGREYLIGVGDLRGEHRELHELVNPALYGPNRIEWDIGTTFGALVRRLEIVCPTAVSAPSEWTRLNAYLTDELAREGQPA